MITSDNATRLALWQRQDALLRSSVALALCVAAACGGMACRLRRPSLNTCGLKLSPVAGRPGGKPAPGLLSSESRCTPPDQEVATWHSSPGHNTACSAHPPMVLPLRAMTTSWYHLRTHCHSVTRLINLKIQQ